MAANVLRFYRSDTGNFGAPRIATAPAGDVYAAEFSSGTVVRLARITTAGSVTWQRQLTFADAVFDVQLASSSSRLAVISTIDLFTEYAAHVAVYNASGALQWQRQLTMYPTTGVVAPDGAVFLIGQLDPSTKTSLVKLNATTGATDWQVCLNSTAYAPASTIVSGAAALSTSDVVVMLGGDVHTGASSRMRVQRIAGADGTITWTRKIAWASDVNGGVVAADPSDNIYVAGPPDTGTFGPSLPVLKLDSSGNTLWNRALAHPSALSAHAVPFENYSRAATANTAGAFFPINDYGDTPLGGIVIGHVFVPAAGTVASSNVPLSLYEVVRSGTYYPVSSAVADATVIALAYEDEVSAAPRSILVVGDESTSGDGAFGPYERTTLAFDTVAGTTTVASDTWTRDATSSLTNAVGAATDAAATTLLAESYAATIPALTGNATGIAPTTAFGAALVLGLVTGIAPTTAFGATGQGRAQPATGIVSALVFGEPSTLLKFPAMGAAFAQAFGTHAINFDLAYAAASTPKTGAFGEPGSFLSLAPLSYVAAGIAPTELFGLPTGTNSAVSEAAGIAATAFGEPTALMRLTAAAADGNTTFGTAGFRQPCRAAGWQTTGFGTPQLLRRGECTAVAPAMRFGLPRIATAQAFGATGLGVGAFGEGHVSRGVSRARSGVFRQVFGTTHAERTAP